MPVRNTMVQLLAPYIDHESHSARHRQTDDRQTSRLWQ